MLEKIVTMKDSSLHTIIAVALGKEVKLADWVEDTEKMNTLSNKETTHPAGGDIISICGRKRM